MTRRSIEDGEDLYWALVDVFDAYIASGKSMKDLEAELSEILPLYWDDRGLTFGEVESSEHRERLLKRIDSWHKAAKALEVSVTFWRRCTLGSVIACGMICGSLAAWVFA